MSEIVLAGIRLKSQSEEEFVSAMAECRDLCDACGLEIVGEITQTPPAFSAIKIDGKRAYDLARQGKAVEIPSRRVTVHSLELLSYEYPLVKICTHVSSGTYIRTLAEDIGKKLDVGAYTTELRRLTVGEWNVEDAKNLSDFGILD